MALLGGILISASRSHQNNLAVLMAPRLTPGVGNEKVC